MRVGANSRQRGDGALHTPQQQPSLGLGGRTGISQGADHARRGEGEQQCRNQGLLDQLGGAAGGYRLIVADPVGQGVNIPVGGQVGGHHPQAGAGGGVLAVQAGGEGQPLMSQAGTGGHNGGTARQQLPDHGRGDRPGGHPGDHGDVLRPAHRVSVGDRFVCGRGGDGLGDLGAVGQVRGGHPGSVRGAQLARPPSRLVGHCGAQTGEAGGGKQGPSLGKIHLAVAQTGQVVTG